MLGIVINPLADVYPLCFYLLLYLVVTTNGLYGYIEMNNGISSAPTHTDLLLQVPPPLCVETGLPGSTVGFYDNSRPLGDGGLGECRKCLL